MLLKDLIESASEFLFPRLCHICGNSLSGNIRYICPSCRQQLPRSLYHLMPENPMEQRFAGHFRFEHATTLFLYSSGSPLSAVIHDMKYRHFRGIGPELGEMAAKELFTTHIFTGIDIIVPIPMHFWKKAVRGYNQAEDIAAGISNITGIGISKVLKAGRPHRTQTSLSRDRRLKNLRNVFRVNVDPDLQGKHILLVDDICTTGATLTEAAKTILRHSPTTKISILTLAATY